MADSGETVAVKKVLQDRRYRARTQAPSPKPPACRLQCSLSRDYRTASGEPKKGVSSDPIRSGSDKIGRGGAGSDKIGWDGMGWGGMGWYL